MTIKATGNLEPGTTVQFLGRKLEHTGQSIVVRSLDGYIEEMLVELQVQNRRSATTPGSSALKRVLDGANSLDEEAHQTEKSLVNYNGLPLYDLTSSTQSRS